MPFQTFCEDPAMLCKLGRTLWGGWLCSIGPQRGCLPLCSLVPGPWMGYKVKSLLFLSKRSSSDQQRCMIYVLGISKLWCRGDSGQGGTCWAALPGGVHIKCGEPSRCASRQSKPCSLRRKFHCLLKGKKIRTNKQDSNNNKKPTRNLGQHVHSPPSHA